MPTMIVTAAVTTAISGGIEALATGAFLKAIAVNAALRVVTQALAPKPRALQQNAAPVGGVQTIRQPLVARQVIYGCDRTGGALTFACNSGDSAYVNLVITWTGHRVKAVRQLIANDEALVQDDEGWMVQGRYRGFFGYESALGTEVGQPFQFAEQYTAGEWSANHRQSGCAKTFIRIARNREVFPNGIPNFSALIDGYDHIYDPRDATYKFTNNAALVAADYLTNATFNKDAGAWSIINETALIAAANICDERLSTVYTPSFTVDTGTDVITFSADETQFRDGDAVRYVSSGGAAGGLTSGSLYYFIRTDSDKGQLATTNANALAKIAIDLTSAGSGTQTLQRVHTFTADITRNRLTFDLAERRLERGDGVRVASSTTLPTGLSAATTYYVIPLSDTQIQLASTFANAWAGTAITISGAGSGTHWLTPYDQARYTIDGTFSLDEKPQEIIDAMQEAMAGHIIKIGAQWQIIAGAYSSPGDTLTEADLDGPRTVQVMPGRTETCNAVRGTYIGRENFWQPTDLVPVTDSTYLSEDNSTRNWKDVRFALVRGHTRVRRLALYALRAARDSITVSLSCKLRAFRVQPGDIIGLTISRYGWTNEPFRVIGSKLVARGNGDKRYLGVDLTLQQITSTRYDWDATLNPAASVKRNTRLPDPFDLARQVPPRVSGIEIPGQGFDGTFTGPDCTVQWRRVGINNRFEIGSEPDIFGANSGSLDYWIEGYRIMITSAADAIYRDDPTTYKDSRFTYTAEQNRADQVLYTGNADAAPVREFHILVYAKSRMGLFSEIPARILVNNPEPTTSNVSATATVDGFQFQYDRPGDTDWVGIEICASTSGGFTPDTTAVTGNLVYKGADIPATVRGLKSGTVYYYQYRLRDQFGAGDWSGELSVTTEVATTQGVSTQHVGAITLPNSANGNRVLGSLVLSRYPTMLPATLSAACLGQATAGGSDSVVIVTFRGLAITSTPSAAGTLTLSYSGVGTLFDLVGVSTDFTQLAANDWILLATGEPLFRVWSITDATHAKVQFFPGVPSPDTAYTYSGAFSAYRGTDLSTITSGSASWLMPASRTLPFTSPGQKTLSTAGSFTGILIVALGTVDLAGTTANYTTVTAEWKTGAS